MICSRRPCSRRRKEADGKEADGKEADGKEADGKEADDLRLVNGFRLLTSAATAATGRRATH